MKTKEQYFAECREREKIASEERREKWTQEIMEELKEWDSDKLEEEYIKCRLGRISYGGSISPSILWDFSHEECVFCGVEYIQGAHESCCDDCWEKNKDKTLEEIENE